MNAVHRGRSARIAFFAALFAALVGLPLTPQALAHDGHAPLPSRGATVQGNQLLLSEPARRAIGVETAKVTLGDLGRAIQAQAQVQLPWHQQALVTTLLPGRVERVLARPGDLVERGQILALIEGLDLETMQRELLRSIAERSLSDKLLSRREELGRSDSIPRADIVEARRDAEEAAARVEVAIRKLLALGVTEEDVRRVRETGVPIRTLPIASPIRGEVVHADVRAGQVVATDEHLFHVVDLSEVEVAGQVLESEVSDVKLGHPATATFTSLPGAVFRGQIEHTHLSIEPGERALTTITHVANPEHVLRPGMSGLMTIQVGLAERLIVCPLAAIAGTRELPYVFLERAAGRYERRPIKVGARAGDRVEVLDGVFPGDRVVVTGTGLLSSLFAANPSDRDRAGSPRVLQKTLDGQTTVRIADSAATSTVVTQGDVELPVGRRHYAASQVEGRIMRILVHPGDDVKAGQVLAEVESLPLRNLQLELLLAKARHKWTLDTTQRLRKLSERQAAALLDLWRGETDLELINQTIGEIRAKLLSLGLDPQMLARMEASGLDPGARSTTLDAMIPIRAPSDGRLEHFSVVPGQVVRPSEPGQSVRPAPLFEIHDRTRVWVCAHVRERDVLKVRTGQPVRVTLPALSGLSVQGSVVRIAPVFDGETRVLPVWIEVDNAEGRLIEGMQARAVIDTSTPRELVKRRPTGGL